MTPLTLILGTVYTLVGLSASDCWSCATFELLYALWGLLCLRAVLSWCSVLPECHPSGTKESYQVLPTTWVQGPPSYVHTSLKSFYPALYNVKIIKVLSTALPLGSLFRKCHCLKQVGSITRKGVCLPIYSSDQARPDHAPRPTFDAAPSCSVFPARSCRPRWIF